MAEKRFVIVLEKDGVRISGNFMWLKTLGETQNQLSRLMTKPTKWLHPAKTQISLGIRPVWSVFAVRMKKAWVLSYPVSAQRRLWSDWANARADLSLRWAHSHFVGFVMRRLNFTLRYCNGKKWLRCKWQFCKNATWNRPWRNQINLSHFMR